jgi:hypothetical protein
MEHTSEVLSQLRASIRSLLLPIFSNPQTAPEISDSLKRKTASLSEFIAMGRTYIERDGCSRKANGIPVTEGNTRLPQQLCQIARGSALLDGRSGVNENDYNLIRRAAFDSLPPARIAVLNTILSGNSLDRQKSSIGSWNCLIHIVDLPRLRSVTAREQVYRILVQDTGDTFQAGPNKRGMTWTSRGPMASF